MPSNIEDNFALQKEATAAIILADGTVFWGSGAGAQGITFGEICFNTSMTGYQEILTDPSYANQIITFTFPHIGIYGCNELDNEREQIAAKGAIFARKPTEASSWRANANLDDWLIKNDIVAVCEVSTRQIVQHIRKHGAQYAVIIHDKAGNIQPQILHEITKSLPEFSDMDLASQVTRESNTLWQQSVWQIENNSYVNGEPTGKPKVIAFDFGIKDNILRQLVNVGLNVEVVPAHTSAAEVLALNPKGIFLSNGPGNPEKVSEYFTEQLQQLIAAKIPIFGICMGHQLLAKAFGLQTKKMHFGHRGANHPVQDLITKKVEITSQNHGFEVIAKDLPHNLIETHISLFDNSNEGFATKDGLIMSVQYHPEASPGPHDSHYLFDKFATIVNKQA